MDDEGIMGIHVELSQHFHHFQHSQHLGLSSICFLFPRYSCSSNYRMCAFSCCKDRLMTNSAAGTSARKRWTKFGFSNPTIGYIYMRTYMWFSKSQSWIVMVQMTPVRIHKNHKNQQTYHRLSSYLVILTIPIIVCIFGKSMNSDSVLLYNQSDWPILENP
jgi:hypothetical protein